MLDVPRSCSHGVYSDSRRSACLKTGLIVFGLISLLLPAAAIGQQTFTGGAIAVSRNQTSSSSGTITISNPTGSSIGTIKIVLNGLTTDGTLCGDGNCWSLLPTSFYLQSPNGGPKLVLLGGTGDAIDGDDTEDPGSGLVNATITIQDGAGSAPNDTAWTPQSGSFTVKPSSYFLGAGQTPPLGSTADFPQTDGNATLTSRFGGIGIADGDVWTLTIENGEGLTTPINISSWQMVVTYASTTPTTTSVSSNVNPAFTTSPNNSVSLTATVSSSSGTPTGTVAFTDNGTTISGCGANAMSGGEALCTTTALAQGYHVIEATYSGGGSYGQSSGSLTQLIEVHPTQSGNTWCNNTSFSTPLNGTGIVYPAVIPVSGYSSGSTVGNVTLELEGVTEPAELLAQFLLVAPGGANNLDFLDSAFHGAGSGTNLFISDSSTVTPNYGTPVSGGTYLPWDGQTQSIDTFPASNSPIVDSGIPSVPGTIHYPAIYGKTNAFTLQQAFSGAPANGDWALYATASNESTALTVGGWCVTLDLNSGIGTTTTLSSNAQKASLGSSVTLTATVTVQGSSTPVSSGTVEFKDETTGTVLASANPLDGSGVAAVTVGNLAEGDHKILASYSGTGTFNTSFTTLYQRIDKTTVVTGSSPTWQFCNTGTITIPMGTSGAETPNPSNIVVSNLPGTLNTATLTLKNFSILVGDQLDNTKSLVVGPKGAALDFFSNTAAGMIEDKALAGDYIFADSGGALVSSGSGDIGPGTYKPTSYVGTDSANDVFTADTGGFFTLPGSFGYSASRGTSTFASEFSNTNPVGTWSLYFNSPNANITGTGAAGGWCLDLTENLPTVTVFTEHSDTFTQGQSNAQFTINIVNNGAGPTGDPTNGGNPMTVTDTLNSAFTYTGGSGQGWTCSTPPATTVICTSGLAIAEGSSYPELTLSVSVSSTAPGTLSNSVSASGAGVATTNSNTDTITIDAATTTVASNASTTFSTGAQSVTLSATVTSPGSTVNAGTVTFSLPGLSGSSPVTSATVTNGAASVSFLLPAGASPGTYTIDAAYNPAGSYEASSDFSHTLTIGAANTTTAASSQTAYYSASTQNVTLNATITSSAGPVNVGTVSFVVSLNSNQLCFVTSGTVSNGVASATCPVQGGTEGVFNIAATYSAGADFNSSSDTTQTLSIFVANSLWIGDSNNTTAAFSAGGAPFASETSGGTGVAIDNSGNVWSLNAGGSGLSVFNNTGTTTTTYSGAALSAGVGLAFDGSNRAWIPNSTGGSVAVFDSGGNQLTGDTGYVVGTSAPTSVAIDTSGNVWIANSGNNSVTKVLGVASPAVPLAVGVTDGQAATAP